MDSLSQISNEMSAALALDLAADIWPEADVFRNHNIDPVIGAKLIQQDWFRQMVDEAKREWSSITNAKQRIRLKSQLAVEHSIETLYQVVVDNNIPAASRVAAFKELKDVSGVSQSDEERAAGAGAPMVNIYLNGDDGPSISITSDSKKPVLQNNDDVIDITPSNQDFGMAPL
jgi:hypothetical protein